MYRLGGRKGWVGSRARLRPERAGPRGWNPSCPVGGQSFGSPWRQFLLATWRALIRAAGAMDAESLLLSLELASGSGQGLSPDRRASLLTSLMLVKRDYRYDRVLFWGRILGLVADYYIAQGLSEDQLSPRKTLYRWRRCPSSRGGPRLLKGRLWESRRGWAW